MYKKIKATKNNSLKKASLMSAVAVLMSCAVLFPERLGFDGKVSTSTYAWGRRWGYRNPFGRRGFSADRYYTHGNDLQGDASYNFDIFKDSVSALSGQIESLLGLNGLGHAIEGNVTDHRRVVKDALDVIVRWKEYKQVGNCLNGMDVSKNWASYSADNVRKCVKSLIDLQRKLLSSIIDISTVLDLSRFRNESKLQQARALGENLNLSELVKLAHIKEIKGRKDGDRVLTQARDLVKDALKCYFNGTRLGESDYKTSAASPWDYYNSHAFNNYSGIYGAADVRLNDLIGVLQTILTVNIQINRLSAFIIGCRTARAMVQCAEKYVGNLSINGTDPNAFRNILEVFLKHVFLNKMSSDFTYLLAVPLALISNFRTLNSGDNNGYELNGSLLSGIKTNRGEFINRLVDALKNNVDPQDLLSTLTMYTSQMKTNLDGAAAAAINYDFGKAMRDVLGTSNGSVANTLFARIDNMRLNLAKQRADALIAGVSDANVKQNFQNSLASTLNAYANNVNNAYKLSGRYTLNDQKDVVSLNYNSSDNISFVANAFALPDTIKYQALLSCYCDSDLRDTAFSDSKWGASSSSWINASSFSQGARKVVEEIAKQYTKSRELTEKIEKIKNSTPERTQTERMRDAAGSVVSSLLTLNGNNTVNVGIGANIAVTGNSLVATLDSLPVKEGKISAVLIPKTSTAESGDKGKDKKGDSHRDLPIVEARNGSVTIATDNYRPEPGNYELHVREITTKKEKGIEKPTLNFLCKFKFVVDADKLEKNEVLVMRDEQQKNVFDSKKSRVYINDKNQITFSLKAPANATPMKTPILILFKEGEMPNADRAQFMLQYNANTHRYTLTSPPIADGKWQAHIYEDQWAAGHYVGEIHFDTKDRDAEASAIDRSEEFVNYLDKAHRERDGRETTLETKTVKVKVPSEFIEGDSLFGTSRGRVEVYKGSSSSGDVISSEDITFNDATVKDDYAICNITIRVPKGKDNSVVIKLFNDYGDAVESSSFKPSEQTSKTVIDALHESKDNFYNYYNNGWGRSSFWR